MGSPRLYKIMVNRKLNPKYNPLIEFVWNYMENHIYCSRVMLARIYMNRFYPNKPNNYINEQKSIRRKVGEIFSILKKFGIVEQFNKNAIRINRERMENFTLKDILSYTIKS